MSLYPMSGSLTGGRFQGRSGLAGADCLSLCALPARAWPPQGCGAPSGSPRSAPFKVAIWFLPLVLLDREQAQAINITVLPFNFSDPGSELPLPFQGSLEQADQWGEGRGTSFHLRFLEGTQEPLVLGLLSFCVMLQQGEDGVGGLFILLVLIPAWTPEHQIPVPLVPSGLAGAGNRRFHRPRSPRIRMFSQ